MSEKLSAVHASIEYIEDRLQEEISVTDIAAAAGYSLYHFIRTFSQTVYHSPYDYLMRRRLSEAARELLAGDRRILDIALDYCFHNHETFSRAFKRMFSITPSQWRLCDEAPPRALMPRLTMAYLEHINQVDFLRPVLVERDEITVAGLMVQGRENLPQLWRNINQIVKGTSPPDREYNFYGVSTYPPISEETPFYLAAVEIESSEAAPPTLVIQTLPAGSYARFIHRGSNAAIPLTQDYIYYTWLPKSDMRLAYPIEIEHFGEVRTSGDSWAIYIPIEEG